MKNLFTFIIVIALFNSCTENEAPIEDDNNSEIDILNENSDDNDTVEGLYEAPSVGSYTTYTSQTSVTINGFIDLDNRAFPQEDSYRAGFIFRPSDENDSSKDVIFEREDRVPYFTGTYSFGHDIDGLESNTTYYYAAFTKNGSSEKLDWKSFTTSVDPCVFEEDNFYNIDGIWKDASVSITEAECCGDGSIGFKFGNWPNTIEVRFNELENGYPKTGQYFGEDFEFDISHNQRELVQSTNQFIIKYHRSLDAELFVENDGERLSLIFCETTLNDGTVINGKVSVAIPSGD